jgi:phenylalanyl-tRNA synthetase alpha chain
LRNAEYAEVLGKNGDLTTILEAHAPHRARPSRPAIGARVNAVKDGVESAFAARLASPRARRAPGRARRRRPSISRCPGALLSAAAATCIPVTQVKDETCSTIFRDLGFEISVAGPRSSSRRTTSRSSRFPPDHPATDMQDSFWDGRGRPPRRALLRTHTSNGAGPAR